MKSPSLSPEQIRTLVSCLGATDAIWLPMRNWDRPRPGNTSAVRREYPTTGAPYVHDGDADARREGSRVMDALAATGLVQVSGNTRSHAVKLSERGEAIARSAAAMPSLAESLAKVREIAALTAAEPGRWVLEHDLAGPDGWSPDDETRREALFDLEDLLLPALTRGLVGSNSTIRRNVAYRLTSTPIPKASPQKNLPKSEDALMDFYYRERNRFDALLDGTERDPSSIGRIPLGGCQVQRLGSKALQ
jgi:hypothetical protein